MPEKQRDQENRQQDRLAQIQKHLEELTPDEVQSEFETFFLTAPEEDLDLSLIDLYLAHLDKVSPIEPGISAEESLKNFHERHSDIMADLETQPAPSKPSPCPSPLTPPTTPPSAAPKKRRLARSLVLVAVVGILVGMMIAQATGFNWMGYFARWTSEVFGFSAKDAETVTEWNPEYKELREVLIEHGIPETNIPKYLEDGYKQTELRADETIFYFSATYQSTSTQNCITIQIQLTTNSGNIRVQKNYTEPEVYIAGNTEYYIMTNTETNQYTAMWKNGNFEYAIFGAPTKDVLYKMIDSIYT